jgi:phenylpropionate dioxygenase-like ring-hydroxylating dioxygenase large terminal subunit
MRPEPVHLPIAPPPPATPTTPAMIDGIDLAPPAPGHLLSPRVFTSPAVFEHELRAIFARGWIHLADLDDVRAPGDYVTARIGRTPVIVIRDRTDGELRGFLNACRHRGARLLDGAGTCTGHIRCPYHAWSYATDGALVGVPYRDELGCDVSALGLVPIRIGTIGRLIFGCLDPDAPELAAWAGALPAALAAVGADAWELAFELRYEVGVNWKLFVENANDGYHIQFVHDLLPDLVDVSTGETVLEPTSAYSLTSINPKYLPPDVDPATALIRFGAVFPTLIPVLSPSDLTYIRVDPIAHDRMALFVRSYDSAEARHLRDFRRAAFEHTTAQDLAVIEKVQAGVHAIGLPPGIYSPVREDRIGHFQRWWAGMMARGERG